MKLDDLFSKVEAVDLSKSTCMSGGAVGSDKEWEIIGNDFMVETKAFSYKTKYHNSDSKVEISEEDFKEGISKIRSANKILKRYGISRYMNLLARNWTQVKYSDEIFAIGRILNPGERDKYYNKSEYQVVSGGTGYAVQMGIIENVDVFVFDQFKNKWYKWNYISKQFTEITIPYISKYNFCGIGTRDINENGGKAIKDVYEKTYNKYNKINENN